MATTHAPSLHEILTKTHVLSPANLKHAEDLQKSSPKKLIRILVDEGLMSEKDLMLLLSEELEIPVLDLAAYRVESKVLKMIPRKIAERYEVIPVSQIGPILTLAMSDPLDVTAMDDIRKLTHCTVRPVIATSRDIQTAIENYYAEGKTKLEALLDDLDPDSLEVIGQPKTSDETSDALAAVHKLIGERHRVEVEMGLGVLEPEETL